MHLPEQLADLLTGHGVEAREVGHVPVAGRHPGLYQRLLQVPETDSHHPRIFKESRKDFLCV